MNQPAHLQAALEAATAIPYVDLPSLMDGVARAVPWLNPNEVRGKINEALSTLFQTPPMVFALALCRPSSQLSERCYYVGSWQSNGQSTLGVLVVCPAGFLEELAVRQSDANTVMAELLETDETAGQLMARLRDPVAARLDANELAASLRAKFMARFHALWRARRAGPEPPLAKKQSGLTEFHDLGITVDLSHTDPDLAAGLRRAHDLGTVKVHLTLKDALEDVFGNQRLGPDIRAHCPDVGTRLIVSAFCPPTEKLPIGKAQFFDLLTDCRPALVILISIPGLIELRR